MPYQDLELTSPWLNAAGAAGFTPPTRWPWPEPPGAWVTNPISLQARSPADNRAAVAYNGGVLLHSGLANPGLSTVLRRHAEAWARSPLSCWAHIFGRTADEIRQMVLKLEEVEGVAAIELGFDDEIEAEAAIPLVEAGLGELPLFISIPFLRANEPWPQVLGVLGVAGITLSAPRGTLLGPNGRQVSGRLYGSSLFPQILTAVKFTRSWDLPVIAAAGVYRLEDGKTLLEAGAAAVQIDTALWI